MRKKLEREAERNEHAVATSESDDDDDDETWVRNMQQQVRADVRARRDWESLATEEKELVRNFVAAQAVPAQSLQQAAEAEARKRREAAGIDLAGEDLPARHVRPE